MRPHTSNSRLRLLQGGLRHHAGGHHVRPVSPLYHRLVLWSGNVRRSHRHHTLSGALALDILVGDCPPDIRHRFGPVSAHAARLHPWNAALFLGAMLVILWLGLFSLHAAIDRISLPPAVVFAVCILLVFDTFSLLIPLVRFRTHRIRGMRLTQGSSRRNASG